MTEFRPSRFEILPLVVKNLVIINVLFFIAKFTLGEVFPMEDVLALHHLQSPLFKPWQLVTYLFLHANFWHMVLNMFGLWMFGARLESLWGPQRFLTFYFICGIGAGLIQLGSLWYDYSGLMNEFSFLRTHLSPSNLSSYLNRFGGNPVFLEKKAIEAYSQLLSDPSNNVLLQRAFEGTQNGTYEAIKGTTIGASGAVFGVLAAFVYLFPNDVIYLNLFIPMKVKWFGLLYFGIEIFSAVQNKVGDNVAHWAHIGGGIVGFLLVLTYNQNRRRFY